MKIIARLQHVARASGNRRVLEAAEALEAAYDALSFKRAGSTGRLAVAAARVAPESQTAHTIAYLAETLHSSLELEIAGQRALDLAVELFSAERGVLMLADAAGELAPAALNGWGRTSPDSVEMRSAQTAIDDAWKSGETLVATDGRSNPGPSAEPADACSRLRSIMCVPLVGRAGRIGVIYLDSDATPWHAATDDPSLLVIFANHAALALENARLFTDQRAHLREIGGREELQAKILGSVTNGIITIDAAGTITTFNAGAAETLGVPAESMIGHPVNALEALVPRLSALLETMDTYGKSVEVDAIHPTRGKLTLQIRIAPLDLGDSERRAKYRVVLALTDFTERRALETLHRADVVQRQAIGDAFSRYLAPHVVESLMKAPSAVELGGERRTATILFADIRDFTKMAARLEAERVVEILNAYFEAAVAVLFENDGLLDKFYGDGLMAVFGPPRVRPDDAARALVSAARLHQVVRDLAPVIREPLRISVGLATGDVVAGHIGSTRRLDYTVIGDAVNLASRLQSAAPPAATYCDETTYLRSGLQLRGERLQAKIKGRADLVTVYRLT